MKIKKFWLFVGIIPLIFLYWMMVSRMIERHEDKQRKVFSCDTLLRLHKQNMNLSVAMSFLFSQQSGVILFKGTLRNGSKVTNISRRSNFTFTRENVLYHFTTTLAESFPSDSSNTREVARILPRFYLYEKMKTDVLIFPVGKAGFIFSTGYVPSFYCERPTSV